MNTNASSSIGWRFHRSAFSLLLICFVAFATWQSAEAHFVWVYVDGGKVHVVLSEAPQPGEAQFVDGIRQTQAMTWQNKKWETVELSVTSNDNLGWMEAGVDSDISLVDAVCDYGVMERGDSKFRLHYSARWTDLSAEPTTESPMPLVVNVARDAKGLTATVLFQGSPVKGVELSLGGFADASEPMTTDDQGSVRLPELSKEQAWIRVRHVANEAGSEGEEIETRFYSTCVIDGAANDTSVATSTGSAAAAPAIPDLPVGLSSFGAAVLDNRLYLYGGQTGGAHSYGRELQNGRLYSIDLDSPNEWKVECERTGVQGNALVATDSNLYQLGGFEARNAAGETHDLYSQSSVLRFQPGGSGWADAPPMTEHRSSFDACRLGSTLYAIGGWKMSGEAGPDWHTTAESYDTGETDGEWKAIAEPPFQKRALALAATNNRVYAIGGMTSDNQPSNTVHVFDCRDNAWTDGPELPGLGRLQAFGCAAVAVDGTVVVSTSDGQVFRLSADGTKWEVAGSLQHPRFFHRMVADRQGRLLVVGGVSMESGHVLECESIELGGNAN